MKRKRMGYWMGRTLCCLLTVCVLVACSHSDDEPRPDRMQGELQVYVELVATRAGDPGTAHTEDRMGWDDLHIYLVYQTGVVSEHKLTRAEYDALPQKEVKLRVPAGTAQVFAVAHTKAFELPYCRSVQDVYNLQAGPMTEGATLKDWSNVFSGYTAEPVNIQPEQGGRTSVRLHRLVAKIDVQYDVQDGLDGKYQNIEMNTITFSGPDRGFFFPDKCDYTTSQAKPMDKVFACDDVSRRNGRTYFYAFPTRQTQKPQFAFSLKYTPKDNADVNAFKGEKVYRFQFKAPLKSQTWYKVNLNVKGEQAISDPVIELVN